MKKISAFVRNNRKKIFAGFVFSAMTASMSIAGYCEGVADESVTTAFTTLKGDVIATLGVVAGLAVAVMGIFLAWKYGRKIFNQVAK